MRNADVRSIVNGGVAPDEFVLRWQVTYACNYSCDFCIQGSHEAHLEAARTESREKRAAVCAGIVRFLEEECGAYPVVHLHLIGGEVTILPDFLDMLERFVTCSYPGELIVHLTTNLSMGEDLFQRAIDIVRSRDRRRLELFASFYSRYTTQEEFEAKMTALARYASSGTSHAAIVVGKALGKVRGRLAKAKAGGSPGPGQQVSLSVEYPILDDECYRNYLELRQRARGLFNVRPVIIRNAGVTLSEETATALKKTGKGKVKVTFSDGSVQAFQGIQQLGLMLEDVERFCPAGYLCDAGVRCVSVQPDGQVWRCPSLPKEPAFSMGSITDEEFTRYINSQICNGDHCSCNYYHCIQYVDR